jgi:hypothetical protein
MSRYRERGKETQSVQRVMMNCLLVKSQSTGVVYKEGKAVRMTCGIVSPGCMDQEIDKVR